ncbi:Zn-dependent hydrolase [Micromonospora sp. NPDC048830]|uniref:Zn-dependent hydrolase n=1 Tax=Micromonospora sp. NPDC048830 TaxID=3364257 RepID=UPI0037173C3F
MSGTNSQDRLAINQDRLWASLMALAEVGSYIDGRSGLRGVNRLALTDAEAEGRRLVIRWMREAGLRVRVDEFGNVYGRREGLLADAPPVLVGSHIDSVATAGAFDGCLGVLGGIEMARILDEHKVLTDHPIEVAFFTEEEGVRFGTDMLGSAVAAGRIPLDEALLRADVTGITIGAELERLGFRGTAPARLAAPHAYVECHIEQGPVLSAAGRELGVVTGVQAISWQELTLFGRSAHAGTTPMELRHDAGLAAAMITLKLHEMVDSGKYGDLRVTVGRNDTYPNLINIVPARVVCTIDLRNPSETYMQAAEEELRRYLEVVTAKTGVQITPRQTAKTPPVEFHDDVENVISEEIDTVGLSQMRLLSGAGHDAGEIAALCPTAMVFVPGEYDGISHNPREYSTPEACANGINILTAVVRRLAAKDSL